MLDHLVRRSRSRAWRRGSGRDCVPRQLQYYGECVFRPSVHQSRLLWAAGAAIKNDLTSSWRDRRVQWQQVESVVLAGPSGGGGLAIGVLPCTTARSCLVAVACRSCCGALCCAVTMTSCDDDGTSRSMGW